MDYQLITLVAAAFLGSSVVTRLVDRYFLRKQDSAIVVKTSAEAADILSQASVRTLGMMETQMATAQTRIALLEKRVNELERHLRLYETRHGPLTHADLNGDG